MEDSQILAVTAIKNLFDDLVNNQTLSVEKTYTEDSIAKNLKWSNGKKILHLDEEFEYTFFKDLFSWRQPKEFFHYTTFESLFSILKTGKLRLGSLTGMNDKSEVGYINNYMGNNIDTEYNDVSTIYHNYHFIVSFSQNKDDLLQWRLYGDDGKGALLKFKINASCPAYKNIMLSSVDYQLKDFEIIKKHLLNFREKLNISFGLRSIDYWKFFYKHPDFSNEKEARLIVNNMDFKNHKIFPVSYRLNKYGIIIPYIEVDCIKKTDTTFFTLDEIMLGPKTVESELNKFQLRHLLRNLHASEFEDMNITHSQKMHYR